MGWMTEEPGFDKKMLYLFYSVTLTDGNLLYLQNKYGIFINFHTGKHNLVFSVAITTLLHVSV
jgi:hypothetical protein